MRNLVESVISVLLLPQQVKNPRFVKIWVFPPFRWHIKHSVFDSQFFFSNILIICPSSLSCQILIELETALLDDTPHWYKLQTHDVSSIPLPQPSPYLPRRHVHGDSPSKKLQSMSFRMQSSTFHWTCDVFESAPVNLSLFWAFSFVSGRFSFAPSYPVYVCMQGLIASLIQSLMMVW